MGMCSPSNDTLEGLPVYVTGYPGPTYDCINSPDPEGNCAGWMYTEACNVSDQNIFPEEFGHGCHTDKGQSGSPVWVAECSDAAVCAIGVHWGTLRGSRAKRLDPATVAHLRQAICATSSDHAPQPSFCS